MILPKTSIIVFLGTQSEYKNTQIELLSQNFKIPYVIYDDDFILKITQNNNLLEDTLNYFADPIFQNGFIFSKSPNDINEIEILNNICDELNMQILCVINLNYFGLNNQLIDSIEHYKKINILIEFDIEYDNCELISDNINKIYPIKSVHEKIKQKISDIIINLRLLSANKLLEYYINNNENENKDEYISLKIKEFIIVSLKHNENKRTGEERRYIWLLGTNINKYNEFVNIFDQYGIEVLHLTRLISEKYYSYFFQPYGKNKLLGIFNERTSLIRPYCMNTQNQNMYINININHDVKCVNLSLMTVFELDKTSKEIKINKFEHKILGIIDITKKNNFRSDIFGWDDIFIVKENGYSFQELRDIGLKISSRNVNVSKWIEYKIKYKKLLSLNHSEIKLSRSIDFEVYVDEFVKSQVYYNNEFAIKCGLVNMFTNVINKGVFFKSAINRRIKNYWCPGLNGGLAIVAKFDAIHESVYLGHDIGHFAIPDLIYIGNNSHQHKQIYIGWRMASEAMTMTIADMLFVDTLNKSNIVYDYSQRKIYPLFVDLKLEMYDNNGLIRVDNLRKIIYANYKFCLFGDDSYYIKMLDDAYSDHSNLNEFKNKYVPFFVSDYKWTHANYNNMLKKSNTIRKWWTLISPLRNNKIIVNELLTLDDIVDKINFNSDDIFDQLFDYIFTHNIIPLFIKNLPLDKNICLEKAFRKYMCGQCAIFSKFNFVDETTEYMNKIMNNMNKLNCDQSINDLQQKIKNIRTIYDDYLQILLNKNFITLDDKTTFNEIYPLFDPMYLSYDSLNTLSIDTISHQILNSKTNYIDKYSQIMNTIIEFSDGKIDDNCWVYEAGVMILSDLGIEHDENLVTFLISGITIDSVTDLIINNETKIIKLTSSDTEAMINPLYYIFSSTNKNQLDVEIQKNIIKYNQSVKSQIIRNETNSVLLNISNSASKCTIITYSITLKELNKLFLENSKSPKFELANIINKMNILTHARYPNLIHSVSDYLNMTIFSKNNRIFVNDISDTSTKITSKAKKLFSLLNININQPEYLILAEFRYKIINLSFNDSDLTNCNKICCENSSILAAYQIVINQEIFNLQNLYDDNSPIITNNFVDLL